MNEVRAVGIGEWVISGNPSDEIKTYGLGSCVALLAYDGRRRIGGLLHVAYPESEVNPERAKRQPGYFADLGVAMMLAQMEREYGTSKRDVTVKLVGGANMLDENGHFNIGKRNALAIKRELWKIGYGVMAEDLGGSNSRTVSMDVGSGAVWVSSEGRKWEI